jgi:hypothetical protein
VHVVNFLWVPTSISTYQAVLSLVTTNLYSGINSTKVMTESLSRIREHSKYLLKALDIRVISLHDPTGFMNLTYLAILDHIVILKTHLILHTWCDCFRFIFKLFSTHILSRFTKVWPCSPLILARILSSVMFSPCATHLPLTIQTLSSFCYPDQFQSWFNLYVVHVSYCHGQEALDSKPGLPVNRNIFTSTHTHKQKRGIGPIHGQ